MPGSFRNEGKLCVHALLILPFVPRSVSPWPVTSQILGHTSQCCFITKCCHTADKTPCSLCFAVSPFSLSSLSHTIRRFHSFCLSGGRCLPCVILHAARHGKTQHQQAATLAAFLPKILPLTAMAMFCWQATRSSEFLRLQPAAAPKLQYSHLVLGCSFLCPYPITI